MAPLQTSVGDVICVLFGCDMPVVLRKIDENSYTFIGGCYVHGIMEGEAMRDMAAGKYRIKDIRIY